MGFILCKLGIVVGDWFYGGGFGSIKLRFWASSSIYVGSLTPSNALRSRGIQDDNCGMGAVVCVVWYVLSGIEAYGSFTAGALRPFVKDDNEDWASSVWVLVCVNCANYMS